MSAVHRTFALALQKARALVVKPAGPEAWFLNYPLRPWRRNAADRERLELLRLLADDAPAFGFLLDDDHSERLSAAIGTARKIRESDASWLFAPADAALRSLGQLYEGNWCLFLFRQTPTEPLPLPQDFGIDPDKIRPWLKEFGASAAVLSLPDDIEWLVVLNIHEIETERD